MCTISTYHCIPVILSYWHLGNFIVGSVDHSMREGYGTWFSTPGLASAPTAAFLRFGSGEVVNLEVIPQVSGFIRQRPALNSVSSILICIKMNNIRQRIKKLPWKEGLIVFKLLF